MSFGLLWSGVAVGEGVGDRDCICHRDALLFGRGMGEIKGELEERGVVEGAVSGVDGLLLEEMVGVEGEAKLVW